MIFTICLLLAYLLGSMAMAIIVSRYFKLPDPRTMGSKNPGATNVLRVAGKRFALAVLTGDALKGTIAVLLGRILGLSGVELAWVGFAAFIGHLYPIYFNFKGGKGVATALGALLGLSPVLALLAGVCWVGVAKKTRYASLAAVVMASLIPLFALVVTRANYFVPLCAISILLVFRHYPNIGRLLAGTEPKIGQSGSSSLT